MSSIITIEKSKSRTASCQFCPDLIDEPQRVKFSLSGRTAWAHMKCLERVVKDLRWIE